MEPMQMTILRSPSNKDFGLVLNPPHTACNPHPKYIRLTLVRQNDSETDDEIVRHHPLLPDTESDDDIHNWVASQPQYGHRHENGFQAHRDREFSNYRIKIDILYFNGHQHFEDFLA
ncbi:hypothetical protein PanWU01x14_320140 [Parasponia andersonii]|uniref:Uncharacterized protein n=1 Tax=Parasponia andersonii TaxID=3476 RepID=A0A2P5ALS1_PARAD|nr:hypothetical protein PanWU01x14_320140 [Parasponia andersonii]